MDKPLTTRQSEVLNEIRSFIQIHGYSPTVRDIAKLTGIKSTNGVRWHLKALEKKGEIIRHKSISRGLVLR